MTDSAIDLLDSGTRPVSLLDSSVSLQEEPATELADSIASDQTSFQEAHQASDQTRDSLTGAVAGGSYANTSNDNQVAVLSTIDYSRNYFITSYYSISYVQQSTSSYTTNNSSLVADSYNNPVAAPASPAGGAPGDAAASMVAATPCDSDLAPPLPPIGGATPASLSSDSSGPHLPSLASPSSSLITPLPDSSSLSSVFRQPREISLDSGRYFAVRGVRRVDRIIDFRVEAGDKLLLSRRRFCGLGALEFATASSVAERRALAATDVDVIYQPSTGRLFFNANGSDDGWGKRGGLFAVLEASPAIGREQFVVF